MVSPSNEKREPTFSMERIGRQIMFARKKKGMTQMELADRMGISFQAVSNWERGLSCPDIAKLFELSGLFDVSIDELLGNPRAVQIATEVMEGAPPALPAEELAEVAPLLGQKQAEQVIQTSLSRKQEPEQPPVSAKELMDAISPLLPFASEKVVAEFAREILKKTEDPAQIEPLLFYMSRHDVGDIAKEVFRETKDAKQVEPLLFYSNEKDVADIAREILKETRDPAQLEPLLFHLSESDVNDLLRSLLP